MNAAALGALKSPESTGLMLNAPGATTVDPFDPVTVPAVATNGAIPAPP
jgi:hypothetical protein